jgi:hypothetical protein
MQSDLDNMNLHELCDLLAAKTTELMKLFDKRNEDGYKLRDLKLEVEKIQAIIKVRKSAEGAANSIDRRDGRKVSS